MHLLHLLSQLDELCAELQTETADECWITGLEHKLSTTLENLEPHWLMAASPTQQQEYFLLLDAYAHPVSGQSLAQRRQRAWRGLLLLESMAPGWHQLSSDSHLHCRLIPAAAGGETNPPASAGHEEAAAVHSGGQRQ